MSSSPENEEFMKKLKLFNWDNVNLIPETKVEKIEKHKFVLIEKSYSKYKTIHPDKSYDKTHGNLSTAIRYIKMIEGQNVGIYINIKDMSQEIIDVKEDLKDLF